MTQATALSLANLLVVSTLTGAIGYKYTDIQINNEFKPLYRWVAVGCVLSEQDKYYLNNSIDIETIELLKSNQASTDLDLIVEELNYFHNLDL